MMRWDLKMNVIQNSEEEEMFIIATGRYLIKENDVRSTITLVKKIQPDKNVVRKATAGGVL